MCHCSRRDSTRTRWFLRFFSFGTTGCAQNPTGSTQRIRPSTRTRTIVPVGMFHTCPVVLAWIRKTVIYLWKFLNFNKNYLKSSSPVEHTTSVQPAAHVQSNRAKLSTHVPLFWHGCEAHSRISVKTILLLINILFPHSSRTQHLSSRPDMRNRNIPHCPHMCPHSRTDSRRIPKFL